MIVMARNVGVCGASDFLSVRATRGFDEIPSSSAAWKTRGKKKKKRRKGNGKLIFVKFQKLCWLISQ